MKDTNRHIAIVALMLAIPTLVAAQEVNHHQDNNDGVPQPHFDDSALQRIMPTRYGGRSRKWREEALAEAMRYTKTRSTSPSLTNMDNPKLSVVTHWHLPDGIVGLCIVDLMYSLEHLSLPNLVKERTAELVFNRI